MKKIDFPLAADVLFYSVCVWFLSLGIMRYYRIGFAVCLACATLFSLAAGALAFLFIFGKHRKRTLSKREAEARDALMLHLALERPERVRAALLQAFTADGRKAHLKDDALTADEVPVVPLFFMQPVSADDVARLIREYGKEQFVIACNALSPEAEKLLATFGLRAMRGNEIYALFARTETTPRPLICGEIPRRTVKTKLRRSFAKSNARPFLISGIVLLTMSLFTAFPVYYLASGSVLLASAIAVRLFGYA